MPLRLSHACAVAVVVAAAVVTPPTPVAAQEYSVVVNSANPVATLTRAQVADIFMRRLTAWPSGHGAIHAVDLPAVSPVRDAFSRAIHGRSGAAVASYWGQQLFSGRGVPPPQRPTDRSVLEFVRGDALAVGYVAAGAVSPDVKVVRVGP